jgi:hypothetical protein
MTDNKARAAANVKAVISKFGGSLSKVMYQFVKKGVIIMKMEGKRLDDVFEQIIEVGVDDAEEDEDDQIKVLRCRYFADSRYSWSRKNCRKKLECSKSWDMIYRRWKRFGYRCLNLSCNSKVPVNRQPRSIRSLTILELKKLPESIVMPRSRN